MVTSQPLKRGEAKSLEAVFNEDNSKLLTNMLKVIHLDCGGKQDYYNDFAADILKKNPNVSDLAGILYNHDSERTIAIRKCILKRSVLLKLRLENKNVTFAKYITDYQAALDKTTKHSKVLYHSIKSLCGKA